MYEYNVDNLRPLPVLSGGLSREARRLALGLLALGISLLENHLHFRLFPFDAAWAAIAACGWPTLSAALRRKSLGAEALFSLGLGIVVLAGHIPAAGALALACRAALDQKDRMAAAVCARTDALASSLPDAARQVVNGRQRFVDVDALRPGDVIRVLPGERVSVDGIVLSGTAVLSTADLNGAALPAVRQPGGRVPGGSLALDTPFTMTAEAAAFDSAARRLLRQRQEEEARLLHRSDRAAAAAAALALAAGLLTRLSAGGGLLTMAVLILGAFAVPLAALPGKDRGRSLKLRRETD